MVAYNVSLASFYTDSLSLVKNATDDGLLPAEQLLCPSPCSSQPGQCLLLSPARCRWSRPGHTAAVALQCQSWAPSAGAWRSRGLSFGIIGPGWDSSLVVAPDAEPAPLGFSDWTKRSVHTILAAARMADANVPGACKDRAARLFLRHTPSRPGCQACFQPLQGKRGKNRLKTASAG